MKKFNIVFLIFLCLFFNGMGLKSTFAVSKTFKEGIYTISDLNVEPNKAYNIENISPNTGARVFIFDGEYTTMQILKLDPSSLKIDTVVVMPDYTVVVVGGGEISINPK